MKPVRVTISAILVGPLLLGFFFVPLPVTRVRQPGLVEVQPEYLTPVHVKVPGILQKVLVKEGEFVRRAKSLPSSIIATWKTGTIRPNHRSD